MTKEEWAADWRYHGADEYLMNATLIHASYRESEFSHHEHCTFCWKRFSESMPNVLDMYAGKMVKIIGFAPHATMT